MNITRNVGRALAASIGSLVLLAFAEIANSAPGDTELVSVNTSGVAVGGYDPAVSADGRFVAFISGADVYVRDRLSSVTERVSVGLAGQPINTKVDTTPALSADGRYVAFSSDASNLVPNDTGFSWDIFVRDRQAQQTVRVNVGSDGVNLEYCTSPAISADGRYVAFRCQPFPGVGDIYVKDLQTGRLEKVSVGPTGGQANSSSHGQALSGDGRYVVFTSDASNLVSGDTNGARDVFLRDRLTAQTVRVSVGPGSTQADGDSSGASISRDGRYVGFVWGDTNAGYVVLDRQSGVLERVVLDGLVAGSLSANGRYVVFWSDATNLVTGDTNEAADVFVHDRDTGLTERASVASNGLQGNDGSYWPSISGDGRIVAFYSYAWNLVPNDSNRIVDVFVHELGETRTPPSFDFTLNPTALAFGFQALGSRTKLSFWLTNKSATALPITSVGVVGTNPGAFSAYNGCGTSLAVGSSCRILVIFRPTSIGAKSAKLRVVAGDFEVRTKPLSGTGVISTFTVSPTSLGFGSVKINTTSAAKFVKISNTGTAVLPISSIALGGLNPYQFARTHNCPANLAVGASCTIRVVFKPTATGIKAALVNITPGGGASMRSVALAGTGIR